MTEKEDENEKRYQANLTQGDVRDIKRQMQVSIVQIGEVREDIKELRSAITGNTLTKEGGILQKQLLLEARLVLLEKKIDDMSGDDKEMGFKMKLIWGGIIFILGIVATTIVNRILKK